MSKLIKHAQEASKAEAHLYVWETIVAILESGSTPDRGGAQAAASAQKIIQICKREQQRCLKQHDDAMAKLAASHGAGVSGE